ncbi:AAEL003732-PA [Aedes aegypti]|uniref:AAEL003732-PA n=1 Tax=Aedes aegypti TaxID=7159 RepID=Q17EM2_AEDAE|nr:AAEL003732-PA [Aedes aegypti]
MDTVYFPVLRKRYKPEYYSNHPLHFSAAEGSLELVHEAIRTGGKGLIYRPVREGETPLHIGIYNQRWDVANALMDFYENDFQMVKMSLDQRGIPHAKAAIWLKNPIGIACTDEECQKARDLENDVYGDNAKVVMLKPLKDDESVVVIPMTETNESHVKGFMKSLEPNGVLAWNYPGIEANYDTFVQLAAFRGSLDLVKRLIANGVDLSTTGRNQMTPLMEACSALQMDMIRFLFEECENICAPTAKDKIGYTAFLHIIPHSNKEGFDYVLKKTMEYRMKRLGESENEAFNQVFRYEGGVNWECLSIWSILSGRFSSTVVEPYLKLYNYDLSFCYGDRIMLMEVIIRNVAKDYYQLEIRQKPELLALADRDGCNVLHCLMWSNELEFVKELYETFPDRCTSLFECDGAIICVASILIEGHTEMLLFLLKNHPSFIQSIAERIMDNLFIEDILPESIFGEPLDIMILHFPELDSRVEELHNKMLNESLCSDDEVMYDDEEYNRGLTYRMLGI